MKKFVIIGNSAAGVSCVEAIREHDSESKITIVSNENYTSYCRCLISYYLAGDVPEERLVYRDDKFYKENNIELLLGKDVIGVNFEKRCVNFKDGSEIQYDKLLIASGSSPRMPDINGINKKQVYGFRTIKDVKGIIENLSATKSACILGGGLIGLKSAYGLHKHKVKIRVIVKSGQVLSQMLDKDSGDMIQRRIQEEGIEIITGQNVSEILGDKALKSVKLENGEVINCNLVVVGKGVVPNTSFLKGSDIKLDWGIPVNENLLTNIDDCFAAGDVAQGIDVTTAQQKVNALWPMAVEQGRVAGLNMAGVATKYDGSIGMNSIEFFGLPVISMGIVKPKDKAFQELVFKNEQQRIYKKLVIKDGIIFGAILLGRIENAGIYLKLIREKVDISKIKDSILYDVSYPKILNLIKKKEKVYV